MQEKLADSGGPTAAAARPPVRKTGFGRRIGRLLGGFTSSLATIASYPTGAAGLAIIAFFVVLALSAPWVAPHAPFDVLTGESKQLLRLKPPSAAAPFGTTNQSMDVFSQVIWGSRIALLVGLTAAVGSAVLGTLIGLFSGYFGGRTDDILMRITDVAFGIPFLPFALVILSITGPSLAIIVTLIVCFLWRTTARVVRSQVLTLRQRPFIWAARAAGTSEIKILFVHIAPNVLPLMFLYMAIGVQAGVMLEAALAFLGFGDPNLISWGRMLNLAFKAGAVRTAWWWVLPPGLSLSLFVIAIFMVTRAYEEALNPRLRQM
ncbi:MAG: ABC transporter permease [Hyphomicrobiaceae bacterium]